MIVDILSDYRKVACSVHKGCITCPFYYSGTEHHCALMRVSKIISTGNYERPLLRYYEKKIEQLNDMVKLI